MINETEFRRQIEIYYDYCIIKGLNSSRNAVKEFKSWDESEVPDDLLDKYNALKEHYKEYDINGNKW